MEQQGSEPEAGQRSEPTPVDLGVEILVEKGERMTVLRCYSKAPKVGGARPRDRSPFGSVPGREPGGERAELLDELRYACATRTRLASGLAASSRDGWSPLVIGVIPGDADIVLAGLRALFERDDPAPIREYIAHPPKLVTDPTRYAVFAEGRGWISGPHREDLP